MTRFLLCVCIGVANLAFSDSSCSGGDTPTPTTKATDQPTGKATVAPGDKRSESPDLAGYRTVENALTSTIKKGSAAPAGQSGYLGVATRTDEKLRLVVEEVEADSPAAKAGIHVGDILTSVAGEKVTTAEKLRALLQSKAPRETVKLSVLRQSQNLELIAALGATSRPMTLATQRAMLGLRVGEPKEGEGAPIVNVATDSPAAKAGLKSGELVTKLNGVAVIDNAQLNATLSEKKPGDVVTVTVVRDKKDVELKIELTAERGGEGRFGRGEFGTGGWDSRVGNYWKRSTYKLAIIGIEYPDVKHNAKVAVRDWEESLFSRGKYVKKNSVTGQPVFGSLSDYYQELSCGAFGVEGKMFDWIEVGKKRSEYATATGGNRTALLAEAMDLILKRDGKEAFKDFDGVFFLYAGERYQTNRGALYWPHRANLQHGGKRWAYFICAEGGSRMGNISVFCHEFGHMLGLPDLYARPENPGSEGLGAWCAMSNQAGNGRPQHFSAWCKEMLGWLTPTVVDPTVKQKLILAPVENSSKECFKVLVRPDGSEYFLLENRRKRSFDESLPAQGLLIWRVVGNRPILEESHGVEGAAGPRVFISQVPFPSSANNAFTPYTTPSSRSQLGGGLPVHITNIRQLPDGRITFHLGYEYE